jgi:hypothetical protein
LIRARSHLDTIFPVADAHDDFEIAGRLQQTGGPLVGVELTFSRRFVLPTID